MTDTARPPISDRRADQALCALQKIGWDLWDPIGIRGFVGHDRRAAAADEYDSYLLQAATLLRDGASPASVAAYLDHVTAREMAMGPVSAARHAASMRTVAAIAELVRRSRLRQRAPGRRSAS